MNKLIEKHRYVNVNWDWWQFIVERFIERAAKQGFEVEAKNVYFSVSSSQGDGASFTGGVDVEKFLLAHKGGNEFRGILNAMREFGGGVQIVRNSTHYAHHNTCGFGINDIETAIRDYTWDDADSKRKKKLVKDMNEILEWIDDIRIELCKKLYRELEEEYYDQISDEAVLETIKSEGLE